VGHLHLRLQVYWALSYTMFTGEVRHFQQACLQQEEAGIPLKSVYHWFCVLATQSSLIGYFLLL